MQSLRRYLQRRVPGARLDLTRLPQVPEIELHLLEQDYPQEQLTNEQVQALMDEPPYWCFCWASGQVLARHILDNAQLVQGTTVVDFGAGSGVVGIAAALAGAQHVIACDQDPMALHAAQLNAQSNGCALECVDDLNQILDRKSLNLEAAVICVADVFYDRDNLPLLEHFKQRFGQVLVADSRLHGEALPGLSIIDQQASCTVPDLNESKDFNRVTVYKN